MAQVWTMYGLNPERMPGDPLPDTMQVLDDAGFTSVLGTNCDQTYARTLRPGEVVTISTRLAEVIGPKATGVGEGYFITTQSMWSVGDEEVATMMFRVLKFKPGTGRPAVDRTKSSRPMINRDTPFFWEGTAGRRAAHPEVQRLRRAAPPARSGVPVVPRDGSRVCRRLRPWHGALVPGAPRPRRTRQEAPADRGAGRPRRGRTHDRRGQRERSRSATPSRSGSTGSTTRSRWRSGGRPALPRRSPSPSGPRTCRSGTSRSPRPSSCRPRWPPVTSRTSTTTVTCRSVTAARTSS